ncbi:hypothetical protein C8Q72DRAFT_796518 [Fomitopsis betulina]|nr:hypothetical protein C8Q72DRAFT_796518 [Fomitopsis betulina]
MASKKKMTRKTTSSGIVTRSASRASVVADWTLREGDIGLLGNIASIPGTSLKRAPISPEEVSAQLPLSPTPDHEDQLRPDSVAEMCRELYDSLIMRMDETDKVIRNTSRFANTALHDVTSAQQRAADVRERTRTTFKHIWQQLDHVGV